jgi:putative sigma-54 modulation protein
MTIEVQVYGKNLEVSDRIVDYVDKKVGKLDRYLSGIEDARVDVAYVKSARNANDRQVAQITVRGKGFILRSEERADDIFAALDTAVNKLERQIERYKGKRNRGRGDGKTAADVVSELGEMDTQPSLTQELPVIAKRKRFGMVPMDEQEAIEQMNLLGHENFFVFYNVANQSINVLYKRRDGSYGIIEPEI